jgi:small subunit ribosomal protein S6
MRERQRDYELMFIISPLRSGEEDINTTISRIQQSITSNGGEVTAVEQSAPWGRRKLAYPIRRYTEGEASRRGFTEGYYVLLRFHLVTTQIGELERILKLNDAILRYMLTQVEYRNQEAAVLSPVTVGDAENLDDTDDDDIEIDEESDEE